MTPQQKTLIQNFILRKIDFSELERIFPSKIDEAYILEELKALQTSRDGATLDYLITLAYRIGFTDAIGRLLSKLLLEDWHEAHEEIARILQFKVKIPESMDDMEQAMRLKFKYLIERDNYFPFVVKCMYAIADLNTDASKSKLQTLAVSEDDSIRKAAQWQLDRINGENLGK